MFATSCLYLVLFGFRFSLLSHALSNYRSFKMYFPRIVGCNLYKCSSAIVSIHLWLVSPDHLIHFSLANLKNKLLVQNIIVLSSSHFMICTSSIKVYDIYCTFQIVNEHVHFDGV